MVRMSKGANKDLCRNVNGNKYVLSKWVKVEYRPICGNLGNKTWATSCHISHKHMMSLNRIEPSQPETNP